MVSGCGSDDVGGVGSCDDDCKGGDEKPVETAGVCESVRSDSAIARLTSRSSWEDMPVAGKSQRGRLFRLGYREAFSFGWEWVAGYDEGPGRLSAVTDRCPLLI